MEGIYSELNSLIQEPPYSGYIETDEEREVIMCLVAKCIEEKHIRTTPITYTEFLNHFKEKGYSKQDLDNALHGLEVQLSKGDYVLEERDGEKNWTRQYFPGLGVRLITGEFLKRHPEIEGVVDP